MSGGEYPDGSASQAFWRYDPVLDVWQEMASMQTPRSELGKTLLLFTKIPMYTVQEYCVMYSNTLDRLIIMIKATLIELFI